jgi:antitoxin (DNA-binding transcriptional repressor) of toxin-antitoxin stability system
MLEYFQDIETTGEELIVTANGHPVLKVIPYRPELTVDEVFADVHGKFRDDGNLLESTEAEWQAI